MYKVTKDKGTHSNVTLVNTETSSSLIIGKVSTEMINILKKACELSEELDTSGVWSFDITNDGARELSHLTLTMKKPIRKPKTVEQPKVEEKPKTEHKKVDAIDVLLGLASY